VSSKRSCWFSKIVRACDNANSTDRERDLVRGDYIVGQEIGYRLGAQIIKEYGLKFWEQFLVYMAAKSEKDFKDFWELGTVPFTSLDGKELTGNVCFGLMEQTLTPTVGSMQVE